MKEVSQHWMHAKTRRGRWAVVTKDPVGIFARLERAINLAHHPSHVQISLVIPSSDAN
jgi:hypothetical protein